MKVGKGYVLREGDVTIILEAMKMEISVGVSAPQAGLVVQSILVAPGDIVKPGDTMLVLSRQVPNGN